MLQRTADSIKGASEASEKLMAKYRTEIEEAPARLDSLKKLSTPLPFGSTSHQTPQSTTWSVCCKTFVSNWKTPNAVAIRMPNNGKAAERQVEWNRKIEETAETGRSERRTAR
ncbi:MAG: hypothetical protein R3C28_30810 [Pirellulaceae bacterium]